METINGFFSKNVVEITPIIAIEYNLAYIENILQKYKKLEDGFVFLKNKRYPISDRKVMCQYEEMGLTISTPEHPIFSAILLTRAAELVISDLNPYRELISNNPLVINSTPAVIYTYPTLDVTTVDEVIIEYIPNIDGNDFSVVKSYLNMILEKIVKIVELNPSAIYTLDTTTPTVMLYRYEDISTYRYYEALENKKEIDKIVALNTPSEETLIIEKINTLEGTKVKR